MKQRQSNSGDNNENQSRENGRMRIKAETMESNENQTIMRIKAERMEE
jgi:hypothetical protein